MLAAGRAVKYSGLAPQLNSVVFTVCLENCTVNSEECLMVSK